MDYTTDIVEAAMQFLRASASAHFGPWTARQDGDSWLILNSKDKLIAIIFDEGNAKFIPVARDALRLAAAVKDVAYRSEESYLYDGEMAELAQYLGHDDRGRTLLDRISTLRDAMRLIAIRELSIAKPRE